MQVQQSLGVKWHVLLTYKRFLINTINGDIDVHFLHACLSKLELFFILKFIRHSRMLWWSFSFDYISNSSKSANARVWCPVFKFICSLSSQSVHVRIELSFFIFTLHSNLDPSIVRIKAGHRFGLSDRTLWCFSIVHTVFFKYVYMNQLLYT